MIYEIFNLWTTVQIYVFCILTAIETNIFLHCNYKQFTMYLIPYWIIHFILKETSPSSYPCISQLIYTLFISKALVLVKLVQYITLTLRQCSGMMGTQSGLPLQRFTASAKLISVISHLMSKNAHLCLVPGLTQVRHLKLYCKAYKFRCDLNIFPDRN